MTTVFITGTAGFIGYHLADHLLSRGINVVGYDGITDYYDVTLKQQRHAMLREYAGFVGYEAMLEDSDALGKAVRSAEPDVIVHLAAQAGVRYSIENPGAYIQSNIVGTFNVMEQARIARVDHLLMASTSSVYGSNRQMPFTENQQTDTPLTLYAATKKANEGMAHSYAHLWAIPTTMFRFFTVYGAWGRPDLALFKFVKAALKGEPIDVYNHGQMARDFTHVGDLVEAIHRLIDVPPMVGKPCGAGDTLSPVAPYRVVNIGNGKKVPLMHFIQTLEEVLGADITKTMMGMQPGDVPGTWASSELLHDLTGYRPQTEIETGIRDFVGWYKSYYHNLILEAVA